MLDQDIDTGTARTGNAKLRGWIDRMAALCRPDSIHWCDGSQAEYDRLCDEMVESGLIATAENYLSDPHGIMCLCCGCCCSNVRGRTRWDNPTAVLPSAFVPQASDECVMCETCVDRCFFGALSMDDDAERSVVDPEKCIGCGVCTITCQTEALKLHRFDRLSKPFDTAIELGVTVARDNDRL